MRSALRRSIGVAVFLVLTGLLPTLAHAQEGVYMTPDGVSGVTVVTSTSAETGDFTIRLEDGGNEELNFDLRCQGGAASCSVNPASISLLPGTSKPVTVSFTTKPTAGLIYVWVWATGSDNHYSDDGYRNYRVVPR